MFATLNKVRARYIDPNDRSAFRLSKEYGVMLKEVMAAAKAASPPKVGDVMSAAEAERLRKDLEQVRAIPKLPPGRAASR